MNWRAARRQREASFAAKQAREKAIAARESAAYGEALKALGDGVVRDFSMVEGLA